MFGKLKITLVAICFILILAEVSVVLCNNLYFEKVAVAETTKRSMPKSSANAIKHAYAASLIYSAFRAFFFTQKSAQNLTILLGKSNEIAETIFKPHQDSSLEMLKDLNNNLLGICAGKWIEENRDNPAMQDRIGFIGNLAERNKIILSREDIFLDAAQKEIARKSFSYALASKLFEENFDQISCSF